jgi:hypothetical protein
MQLSLLAAEAAQLARLCDLAEPLVEVVLVLPSPLDPDVVSYWDKILEVGEGGGGNSGVVGAHSARGQV